MEYHRKNIHIIPVAFDIDGIIAGLKERPAHKAILLHSWIDESREEKISRRNVNTIRKSLEPLTKVEVREIVSADVQDILMFVTNIITGYPEDRYVRYVNVSSGTSLLNSILLISAMAKKCGAYVVSPERIILPPYRTLLTMGAKSPCFLPHTPLALPSNEETSILNILLKHGGSMESQMHLLEELERIEFFKPEKYFQRRRKKILANRKTMLTRLLIGMEKKGLIEREHQGRMTNIHLTSTGKFLTIG
ncbi:MAG: DUF6293 family protein [Candidatus Thermoplasmatota archaeon]|jgi:hypothetical protein|nr:DUF6293 family protein [Candidatus Thermoplasmatota archaeon]MDP7266458.1 DUF6293 family protein [Candidatus Thermoplasmatota archaeon]